MVAPDGSGDFPTIQDAIDAALDGDAIELTDGVFTGAGNREIDYRGKSITVRSQSGDSSACVIDCQQLGRGFHFHSGEDSSAVLTGVTITGGYLLGYLSYGGGICIENYTSPKIERCVLRQNRIGFAGGGLSIHTHCDPIIRDCFFEENVSRDDSYGQGGGIYCGDHCDATIERCTLVGNEALVIGGGIMPHLYSAPEIRNCTLVGNRAPDGANVGCRHHGWPQIENTIIAFGEDGAGVFCMMDSDPLLTCCDVYGNAGGDWIDCIAEQFGVNGNICEDPLFCDDLNPDAPWRLREGSPCAPFTPPNAECDLIGAWPEGCQPQEIDERVAPRILYLGRAQPNPFLGSTRIVFGVPADVGAARVRLRVFDLSGRLVRTLRDGPQLPGYHEATWDGTSNGGRAVANGVYYYELRCAQQRRTRGMTLIR